MFVGHFGVGFGAKAAAPKLSLGTLFLAAQFVDLLWPTMLLLGLETVEIRPGITKLTPLDFVSYPITHSLLMAGVWGLVLGAAVKWAGRATRSAVVVGLAVVSHWFLDLVVHRPDLPLVPWGGPKLGLGVWNSLPGTLIAEASLLALGVGLYLRRTRARDRVGSVALWVLIALLVAIELANLFGPPPPNVRAIAVAGHAQWLFVAMAYWIDRHRELVSAPS